MASWRLGETIFSVLLLLELVEEVDDLVGGVGGVGDSGFGRIHGEDGLREFVYAKAVTKLKFASLIDMATFDRSSMAGKQMLRLARMLFGR